MRNNNTAIVRRITRRTLSSDKWRNFFIIAAIALTAFMLASVFSIGVSYYESINMQEKRLQGSVSHMAFAEPTGEQLKRVYELDYVKTVGIGAYIARTTDFPRLNDLTISYVDKEQWKEMFCPTYTNIKGHYPEQENEIMLSRYMLEGMGIDNPEIGMQIPISYTVIGTDKVITKTFVLSCIYTEYASVAGNKFASVYSSHAFAEKSGRLTNNNINVNIIFKDAKRVGEHIERLKQDLVFSENQPYVQSPAFDDNHGSTITYIAFLVLITFLMFTGYLLIYNVMYISVSRDIQFYGMLKTVGTTPRQIRSIVIGQVMRLCTIALPVGCLVSVAVSLLIVPAILISSGIDAGVVVSFSPVIYIGAAVFAVLTAWFGAVTPARKAADISPIEALKYTEGGNISKTSIHSPANAKPYKMALRNIFRDRRRALVVMLSLFLGIVTFTSVLTIIISNDIDYRINNEYKYDYSIGSKKAYPDYGLNEDFISSVKKLEGVAEMGITSLEAGDFVYAEEFDAYVTWLSNKYNIAGEDFISKTLGGCGIRGIDSFILSEINQTLSTPFDVEAFENGEFALVCVRKYFKEDIEVTECLSEVSVFEIEYDSAGNSFVIANGGIVFVEPRSSNIYFSGPEILVSNQFLHQYIEESHRTDMDINVEKSYDAQIYHAIQEMINPAEVEMISRYEARKSMQEAQTIMWVLGGGISLVLGLIGIFNFINVMSVGIMTRRRELAALESVGMSKKQMRAMLRSEGIGYAVITILCSVTLGNLITYGMFLLFKKAVKYVQFTYPFIPVFVIYIMISLICVITPEMVYRGISKKTLVERLREE